MSTLNHQAVNLFLNFMNPNKPKKQATSAPLTRRGFVGAAGVAASAIAASTAAADDSESSDTVDAKSGRLNQSVCKWCYGKFSLDQMAQLAAELGLVGIDLLDPKDFETVKKYGLVCTMVQSHPLPDGLCDPQFHTMAIDKTLAAIEATAAEGWKNVICFSGNARGIDRETGMQNCIEALKEITPVAEENGVTVQMELLNSKVDHADYMCDNSTWGVELVKRVGSDHFKLLYDIYHMQIMEGDIIRTIERDHKYFGHYHTAGNPGRHELDENQELLYPPIARAIADVGYSGYFAHEFIPTGDPTAGLTDAVRQCTV